MNCNYANALEKLLCDRIVQGVRDQALVQSLLEDQDLTLAKAVSTCLAFESAVKGVSKKFKRRLRPAVVVIPRKSRRCINVQIKGKGEMVQEAVVVLVISSLVIVVESHTILDSVDLKMHRVIIVVKEAT